MIKPYKGREVLLGQRVEMYKNVTNKSFSLKGYELNSLVENVLPISKTKKVLSHSHNLLVTNCELVVSSSGRQRVIDCGQKNVHAYVKGTLFEDVDESGRDMERYSLRELTYNPYKNESFVYRDSGERVDSVKLLYADAHGKVYKVEGERRLWC